MSVRAIFYRERNVGDLVGFQQALADALQAGGMVANDRQIVSWDGSRLAKDPASSRVDVVISRFDEVDNELFEEEP